MPRPAKLQGQRLATALLGAVLAVPAGAYQAPTSPLRQQAREDAHEPMVSRPGATGLLEVKPEDLPPQLRLGRRVEVVRRACEIIPTVVIVRDARSYIEAIATWTPTLRFPVLIDDGSGIAREDIARFVRGFKPTAVVRWGIGDSKSQSDPSWARVPATTLTLALARACGFDPANPGHQSKTPTVAGTDIIGAASTFLLDRWRVSRPPGLVITSEDDPAWAAALPLAAFRGQPLVFRSASKSPGTVGSVFSAGDADALATEVEGACALLAQTCDLKWTNLGDDLDAVTLCLNCPVKVWVNATDQVATTDRLGRLGTTGVPLERWAWAGQLFGSAPQASYRAMCALFLVPTSAWLFDGYPDKPVWNEYDCTSAAATLKGFGLTVQLDDTPRQSDREWRARVAKPLASDLVLVTTKGNADFFDLEPGTRKPGDVPIFLAPAAVHFTHSWSAQWPLDRGTLAGRWLERGVYSYVGSVQEPYLQSFVQTNGLALRLVAGGPWGLVARMDGGPFAKTWKIAVIGDPLAVLGDPLRRGSVPLPLADTTNLEADSAASLKEGRFVQAIADQVMLGRDDNVHRLVIAMRAEKSTALTPDILAAAILPTFRRGHMRDLFDLYALLPEGHAKDPILRDALWLAASSFLDASPEALLLETLRKNLRDDQIERDAVDLARAWALRHNRAEALTMLRELRPRYTNAAQKQALEKAIAAYAAR